MSEELPPLRNVYQLIANVQKSLSEVGIGKGQTNTFDKYKFRGIDDVYNALGPILSKHGLVVLPEVTAREITERTSQKGTGLFHVILDVTYHFVSSEDGSEHLVPVLGEAMDRGDKAINKAMSAAYKYACFQTFCIPVDGQDAEQETHEVKPRSTKVTSAVLEGETVNWEQASEYKASVERALFDEDWGGLKELLDELNEDHVMKTAVWDKLESRDRTKITKWIKDQRETA